VDSSKEIPFLEVTGQESFKGKIGKNRPEVRLNLSFRLQRGNETVPFPEKTNSGGKGRLHKKKNRNRWTHKGISALRGS